MKNNPLKKKPNPNKKETILHTLKYQFSILRIKISNTKPGIPIARPTLLESSSSLAIFKKKENIALPKNRADRPKAKKITEKK
tara:strand:+ start:2984 stop:3232 length:249 start_codon:yes stop_codon:yes gene_type:complete